MVTSFSKAKRALSPADCRYGKLNSEILLAKIALCISRGAVTLDLTRDNGRLRTISPWICAHFLCNERTTPTNFPTTNPPPDRLERPERPRASGTTSESPRRRVWVAGRLARSIASHTNVPKGV
jgi:hypothetical protein